jgi:hypothetical protein
MYPETSSLPQVEWIASQPFREVLHLANLDVAFEVSLEGNNLRIAIVSDKPKGRFIFNPPLNLSYAVKGLGVGNNVTNGIREWNDSGVIHDEKNIFSYELPFYETEGEYLDFCVYYGGIPVFYLRLIPQETREEKKQVSERFCLALARSTLDTLIIKPEGTG